MNESSKTIANLIARHLNGELNDQEKQELNEWVEQSSEHRLFFQQLTGEDTLAATVKEYERSKGIVYDKIKEAIEFDEQAGPSFKSIGWFNPRRFAAVAASVILIGGAIVWWSIGRKENRVPATAVVPTKNDQNPASEGAVLKLADGNEIILDDADDGAVAQQGNTEITKQGGLLSYNSKDPGNTVLYNTLSTPKGRIYKLALSDGSKVWLNAASSIRFPTAFNGNERSVQITGEVYFEVQQDANTPFHVTVNQRATIDVLGTSFNVNGYGNEQYMRTTLLEGSVRISTLEQEGSGNSAVLKPGQQAQLQNTLSAAITIVQQVNTKKVMGWKDGYFSLDDLTLEELMREVERWYDVEVVYEKEVPVKTFFGRVNRDLSLLDFMEGLKDWGVRFRLEGRKLIITGVD